MNRLVISGYGSNFNNYDHLYTILDRLRFAQAGVEFCIFSDKPDYLRGMMAQKDRFREFYTTLHGPHVVVEPSSPLDSEGHRAVIQAFRDSAEYYRAFSSHSIVMHTNQRTVPPEEKRQLQENVVATTLEMAGIADETEMKLLMENVGEDIFSSLLFDEKEFIALFDRLPRQVGCLLDVGHAIINRWDIPGVVEALGDRIEAYHLHNNDGTADSHRPMFEAGLRYSREDYRRLFRAMEEKSPRADWILEYAPGRHITPELMEEEVRTLLELMNS